MADNNKAMYLVTGYTGTPHVTATDDSIRNVMLGAFNGKGVFPVYDKFAATAITANEVRVLSGYGINQGRLFKIGRNDFATVTIENGAAGVKRADLIVARYTRDENTGIEDCDLEVIKGTAGSSYVDPEYTTGTLLDGDLVDDMPMYRVKINGVVIEAVEPLFTTYTSLIGGVEPVIKNLVDEEFNTNLQTYQDDFEQMINDDDDAFEAWFAQVQAYLDEDTAARLSNAVANLNNKFANEDGTGALKTECGGTGLESAPKMLINLESESTQNIFQASPRPGVVGALPVSHGGTGKSDEAGLKLLLGNLMYPVGSIYMSADIEKTR